MEILMRAHVRVMTRTGSLVISMLDNDRKFMCIEFGWFVMNGYEDMYDEVKSQNGG